VIPFRVHFRPGLSLYEQVVYAATKAMIAGQMRPGDPFPSVRVLSKELKINPNTAHKVVTYLVTTGLLETRPGIGTVVAVLPEASAAERTQLLGREIEALVVEAKKLGITLEDMAASIGAHWKRLGGDGTPSNQATPSESSSSELRSGESGRGGRGKR
jgi:GntR family transcriptional regulator